jgi:hypothetical protein
MADDQNLEWIRGDEDELVRRLRTLQWPEVSPELRERCWEEFSRRIADKQLSPADSGAHAAAADLGGAREYERHEFSRRLIPVRGRAVLGHRLAVADAMSHSSSPRVAASLS